MGTHTLAGQVFNRTSFDDLLKRRMFFTEALEVYRTAPNFKGDNRGLYDYGPPGCGLQANIVDIWRTLCSKKTCLNWLVQNPSSCIGANFARLIRCVAQDCSVLTPEDVFKTSGHVERFADWMCKDPVKGDYLRADHLVEGVLDARLAADRNARGTVDGNKDASTQSKLKKKIASKEATTGRLDDATVTEYGEILAQVMTSAILLLSHKLQCDFPTTDRQL